MKEDNKLIAEIKRLIEKEKDNEELSLGDYYRLRGIIGKAERGLQRLEIMDYLNSLDGLIRTLSDILDDKEKLAVQVEWITTCFAGLKSTLSDFSRRITVVDKEEMFDDYRPISLRDLLRPLCVQGEEARVENGAVCFTPRDENILEREVNVCEDDGMGYCASGPKKVFCSYQDEESGNINLWF